MFTVSLAAASGILTAESRMVLNILRSRGFAVRPFTKLKSFASRLIGLGGGAEDFEGCALFGVVDQGAWPSPMELSMRMIPSGLMDLYRVRRSSTSMTPSDHPARTKFPGAVCLMSSTRSLQRRSGEWEVAICERPWDRGSNAMTRRVLERPLSWLTNTSAGIIQPGTKMRVFFPEPASE